MSHRNEPARSRRRQLLKEQFSIRSIPLDLPPQEKYNLENHFGWRVLQKCRVEDGTFPPYLVHCIYCGKPDVPSGEVGDRDKVTYVLYIRGKDGDLEHGDVKETQTSVYRMPDVINAAPPPVEKPKKQKGKNFRRSSSRRRKVISEFYYIPIQDRVMSRYDIPSGDASSGETVGTSNVPGKKGKKGKGRGKPKSWQLRAGAELCNPSLDIEGMGDTTETEVSDEEESGEEEEEETGTKFINNLKKYDCTDCFAKVTNVELMESPVEKNRYLYLPRERYEKRHHNTDDKSTSGSNASNE